MEHLLTMNIGQYITSPEGPGEVLTIFDDKVVIKLINGQTTTLPADQVRVLDSPVNETDLTQESPEAVAARAEHAGQILAKLDHLDEEHEINQINQQNNYQQQIPMEMSENALDVINDLIEINNDRIEGFEKAANDLEDQDSGLNTVFNKLAEDSRQNVAELTEIVLLSGNAPVEGSSASGALHRAWLDVKAVFTGGDLEAILNECERGEDAIKAAYQSALDEDNQMSPELVQMLTAQQQTINDGHDLIKSLRDQVEADNNDDEETDEYDTDETEYEEDTVAAEPSYEGAAGEYKNENAFTPEPTYQGAASEYKDGNAFIPEPEDVEQEEAWQESQVTSTSDSKLMEFFVDQLKDLLWAERELVDTLPDMAEAATSQELKTAFTNHMTETATHADRLEQIFGILGLEPEAKKCDAMAGIVDEGDNIISNTDEGTAQRDVGLIFAGQKAEHYEIASYGGMVALAKTLGYYEIAEILVLTLDEEKTADALLTDIAENHVNYEASTEPADE
jgi:uncharacterized protein (TIGR02284 family)